MKNIEIKNAILGAGLLLAWITVPLIAAQQPLLSDDKGDAAFLEDLSRVKAVAEKNIASGTPRPQARDAYVARQVEKYHRFNKFAKETLAPHSRAIAEGRKDPDSLLATGKARLARDGKSWEGHDCVGTAKLFKRDPQGAEESFGRALEAAPAEMRGWYQYMLGLTAQTGSEPDKALAWLDKAIEDDNNWLAVKSAHLNKAAIYVSRSSFKKAAASLETYFSMARGTEAKLIAAGPICKMTISAGLKVGGCTAN
ncbi:MAG: hypothetical protein COT18_02405 [Elusimicrobia bacterium CG08_land_8_20_14_0_20_59_10]|nr:MAG: hypothetical protein COT18_02405 [Elusimicrobia bacterium CG08_land_8_20_14_0_20_59_10]